MTLQQYLQNYHDTGVIPFHMPGHKRNMVFADYLLKLGADVDFTEIDATDDLHHAQGILKTCMRKAEKLWHSQHSYFMVNGSTGGILSGIRACTDYGDKILVARNCHKAVYNALELCGLQPLYLLPDYNEQYHIYGSISPERTEKILQNNPDIKLIVITSPTYEGILSDIRSLADIAHRFHIPLMVDEAHGSHLDLSPYFTGGAVKGGADISVQSLHKTLPSLTQSAVIHLNSELVSEKSLQRQLALFQTSSPSYILMASADACIERIKDCSLFATWYENLMLFQAKISPLQKLKIFGYTDKTEQYASVYGADCSKIVISCADTTLTGIQIADILHCKYHIDVEMSNLHTLILMTSMADTKENLLYLAQSLLEIDRQLDFAPTPQQDIYSKDIPESRFCIAEAVQKKNVCSVSVKESVGKISAEYIWIYPPGIPIITPGEVINSEITAIIHTAVCQNLNLQKTITEDNNRIAVVAEYRQKEQIKNKDR